MASPLVLANKPLLSAGISARSREESLLNFFANRLHGLKKLRSELKSVCLEVTTRCNLQCRHCFVRASRSRPKDEMSFAELCGLALSIRRDFGTRVPISITGGEPLTRRDIFLLIRTMNCLGLTVTLSTNGTWLYPECVDRLVGRIAGLAVSLDGSKRGHDRLRGPEAFEATITGLRLAVEAGIPGVVVKTAVHRGNLHELPDLMSILLELGVREWHIFALEPWGRGRRMDDEILSPRGYEKLCDFFDLVKDEWPGIQFEEQVSFERRRPAREHGRFARCSAGISSLAILANGNVVPCAQPGSMRRAVQGNVRQNSLMDIWRSGFGRSRTGGFRHCGCHAHRQ